jgi:hypothetical protein
MHFQATAFKNCKLDQESRDGENFHTRVAPSGDTRAKKTLASAATPSYSFAASPSPKAATKEGGGEAPPFLHGSGGRADGECITAKEGGGVRREPVKGHHPMRSFGWRVVSAVSMTEGKLSRHSASVVRCHPRHFWLWRLGGVVNLSGILPPRGGCAILVFGWGGAPKFAK